MRLKISTNLYGNGSRGSMRAILDFCAELELVRRKCAERNTSSSEGPDDTNFEYFELHFLLDSRLLQRD